MTNFEKYMNTIVSIRNQDSTEVAVAMDIETGILRRCGEVGCERCKFSSRFNGNGRCEVNLVRWLFSEYQEPAPKVTKADRGFCKTVKRGYIVRHCNGMVTYYTNLPHKVPLDGHWWAEGDLIELKTESFLFIRWEDTKPWRIEDLLKLEVEE